MLDIQTDTTMREDFDMDDTPPLSTVSFGASNALRNFFFFFDT
jgi:hypothetical protein